MKRIDLKEMEEILEFFSVYFNTVFLTVYDSSFTESYRVQFRDIRKYSHEFIFY